MAHAVPFVPFEVYIPAGGFIVPLDSIHIADDTALQKEWHAVLRHDGWLLSRQPRSLPTSTAAAPENHDGLLPLAIQQLLIQQPSFVHVVRPLVRQWIRFEFRRVPSSTPMLVSSPSPSPPEPPPPLGVCRIYVLPDDEYRRLVPRSDAKVRRDLQLLMNGLDYSKNLWRGIHDAARPRVTVHAARRRSDDGDRREDSDTSLLHMFNTIPSPSPQTPLPLLHNDAYQRAMDTLATSKMCGLRSTLYAYQIRSVSVMLQRELWPGRVIDPRLLHLTDQSVQGRGWYYDDVNGEVLRAPRLYDGVSGGILAEEMGTGKTLICLALILATRAFPAAIPEVCQDHDEGADVAHIRRPRVGSLADMAAAVVTRRSVPWKLYLEDGNGHADAAEYRNCIDIIKRNPATYVLPRFKMAPREHARSAPESDGASDEPPVTISSCSLVLVPANLVRQWQQEIAKHTTGLRTLVVAAKQQQVPSVAEILDADILLFSIPYFERLEQHRTTGRGGYVLNSPLARVHFKRVIVDEGHRLGNSRIGRKSNLLLVLDCLRVSTRWIVTGTPSTGLFGVTDADSIESDAATSSSQQERRDLERLGAMASLYLRVRPWANTVVEVTGSDRPADWAVYVMQRQHSSRSSGRLDCLRATLDALIVRHRASEVGDLLPAVEEHLVVLPGSRQDRLCLNLFAMMIIFNAVQSQRTDQDYLFHPSQRGALLQLLSNMRQATLFGAYFFPAAEIARALATADDFVRRRAVTVSDADARLLDAAMAFGRRALADPFKQLADRCHEVPIYVRDMPGPDHGHDHDRSRSSAGLAAAWSIDPRLDRRTPYGTLTCTVAPMVRALQQFLRPCLDAPHALQAMFDDGRFVRQGREARRQQEQQRPPQEGQLPPPPPSRQQQEQQRSSALPASLTPATLRQARAKSQPVLTALGTPSRMEDIMPAVDSDAYSGHNGRNGRNGRNGHGGSGDGAAVVEVAAPLARCQLVSTASAKLSYLLDAIVRHQEDEQIIVFYDNENVAFYLAEHLEILQIRHLIYAKGITAERRAQYVATFNGEGSEGSIGNASAFRVLLMDLSQAAFGLDMRAASRVYFVSPVLNPQVAAQAIGRVRRISQRRQVSVETLVLQDSLEEMIVRRGKALTPAEHSRIKSLLDDRPIYDWIVHAKIVDMDGPSGSEPGAESGAEQGYGHEHEHEHEHEHGIGPEQMAPLKTPQFLFGRGVGRVEHPDEGLVAQAGGQGTTDADADADRCSRDGRDMAGARPSKKRKMQHRPRVRFA